MFKKKKDQNNFEVVQLFMNHCATIIQANFKGYSQRKYYKKFIPIYKRFKQLLYAGFIGWKTRKILKLSLIKNKIQEIKSWKSQQKNLQMRIFKRDFADEVNKLVKSSVWLYYNQKQKRIPLSQRCISAKKNKQQNIIKKTNLKQALCIIPKSQMKKPCISNNENQYINKQLKVKNVEQNFLEKEKEKTLIQEHQMQVEEVKLIKKQKQKKTKKVENLPPKKNKNAQYQQKQLKLSIQNLEQAIYEVQNFKCKTPTCLSNQSKQLSFRTRPRQTIRKIPQQKIHSQKNQQIFKPINILKYSQKKGLNMTMSKKYNSQNLNQIIPINQNVLQDFTKNKQSIKDTNQMHSQSPFFKQISIFQTNHENQNKKQTISKINNKIQMEKNLTLQIKKDDFLKKKLEFQIKSKQFKNVSLN